MARTVERMLDALGYQQVDVLGVSLGGVIAQQLAHQAPDRVRRLVLAATGPGSSGGRGTRLAARRCWRWPPAAATSQPDYYRRVAGDLYGGAARTDPDALLHGSLARFSQAPSLRGYLAPALRDQPAGPRCPGCAGSRQPTLVLAGDDDPIVPGAERRMLAHCIPDARLHVVPRRRAPVPARAARPRWPARSPNFLHRTPMPPTRRHRQRRPRTRGSMTTARTDHAEPHRPSCWTSSDSRSGSAPGTTSPRTR